VVLLDLEGRPRVILCNTICMLDMPIPLQGTLTLICTKVAKAQKLAFTRELEGCDTGIFALNAKPISGICTDCK